MRSRYCKMYVCLQTTGWRRTHSVRPQVVSASDLNYSMLRLLEGIHSSYMRPVNHAAEYAGDFADVRYVRRAL